MSWEEGRDFRLACEMGGGGLTCVVVLLRCCVAIAAVFLVVFFIAVVGVSGALINRTPQRNFEIK